MELNPGMQLACAMWALTALSLTLIGLRLYTRMRIIKFVGAEDHMYAWTGLFLLAFTCAIQVCVHYGLGQNFWSLPFEESSNAIFWTYVANSFAITGNAMAKLSMGLFLLRVVQIRWQRIALWVLIAITAGTSIALTIMLWNQTDPVKASWDPIRTPGVWKLSIQPLSVGLGAWSSACDFFFAIFPWLFIWSLRMPQREKLMLAGGMSLGVIAGVCGIVRTVVLSRINVYNYTLNFVPYFGWAGAEIAVALFCVGIPTLRPLYMQKRHGSNYGAASRNNHMNHYNQPAGFRGLPAPVEQSDDRLPRFTMIDAKAGGGINNTSTHAETTAPSSSCSSDDHDHHTHDIESGGCCPLDDSRVLAAAAAAMSKPVDLESVSSRAVSPAAGPGSPPLSPTSLQAMRLAAFARFPDAATEPPTPARPTAAHMRSVSNGAVYTLNRLGGGASPGPARPATAHTRSYDGAPGHERSRRNDSVDAILGLYDRSARNNSPRGILVTREVHVGREENLNWPLRS